VASRSSKESPKGDGGGAEETGSVCVACAINQRHCDAVSAAALAGIVQAEEREEGRNSTSASCRAAWACLLREAKETEKTGQRASRGHLGVRVEAVVVEARRARSGRRCDGTARRARLCRLLEWWIGSGPMLAYGQSTSGRLRPVVDRLTAV
jgi:hypothetical protein